MGQVQKTYSSSEEVEREWAVGDYCAAMCAADGRWHRGQVLSSPDKSSATVRAVDFGFQVTFAASATCMIQASDVAWGGQRTTQTNKNISFAGIVSFDLSRPSLVGDVVDDAAAASGARASGAARLRDALPPGRHRARRLLRPGPLVAGLHRVPHVAQRRERAPHPACGTEN